MKNKHYAALLNKSITVQLRQKKTNVGFLTFVAALLICLLGIQYGTEYGNQYIQMVNSTNVFLSPTTQTCTWVKAELCFSWFLGWYSDAPPPSDPAGALPNSTDGHSGLLGNITQLPFDNWRGIVSLVPYFLQKKSPQDIDNQLISTFNNIAQQIQPEEDYSQNMTYLLLLASFPSAAINFNRLSKSERVLDYTVQVPYSVINWPISNPQLFYYNYMDTAHLTINMITNAFVQSIYPYTNVSIVTTSMNFPYNFGYSDFSVTTLVGMFFVPFALALPQLLHLFSLVSEKHERLREMMKMMGMRTREYWVSTYVFGYLLYLIIASIIVIVCLAFRFTVFTASSNPLSYLLIFFLYGHTQVSFTMLLSCFFWKPIPALIFGILVNMFSVGAIASVSTFQFLPIPSILLLIPPIALTRSWGILSANLVQNPPLIPERDLYLDRYSLLVQTYVFMILSTFVCLALTLYLDKVLPREHGVTKSPLLPLISIYNKIKRRSQANERRKEKSPLLVKSQELPAMDDVSLQTEDVDCSRERKRAHSDEEILMKIVDLSKKYPRSDKFSLFGFSLVLEEGECLGLLGPNGAGKTTLISVLCGLTKPTSGNALVQNHSITNDLDSVHELLGFCPQQDILWQDMTVEEHLLFYCALKNHGGDIAYLHVQRLANEIGLSGEHLHKRVSQLSAGMKRRLSTGIALVGSSRVVLLDEPTSGLDHVARRAVWDIIERQKKAGRSFIITTHDMSEADVLCSRIAIISRGRMQKLGSPAYLKAKLGNGYNLKLSVESGVSIDKAQSFFAQFLPNAIMSSCTTDTLEFMINDPNINLGEVYTMVARNSEECGILEWSINPTSLEQVFLQLAHNDEIKE